MALWFGRKKKAKMTEEEIKNEAEKTEKTEAASDEAKVEEAAATEETAKEEAKPEADAAKPEEPKAEEKPAEIDWKALYTQLRADFDNYKKRQARDREDVYRYAEGEILKDVLPVIDNLQLALANAADKEDPFVKGVKLVEETFLKALKDHQAEPFDSIGQELDPEKMDAIAKLPSEEIEEGKVSIESKKGWMLKGKVLRAAQVVVSAGKPA